LCPRNSSPNVTLDGNTIEHAHASGDDVFLSGGDHLPQFGQAPLTSLKRFNSFAQDFLFARKGACGKLGLDSVLKVGRQRLDHFMAPAVIS
jgi:hypothetical protein